MPDVAHLFWWESAAGVRCFLNAHLSSHDSALRVRQLREITSKMQAFKERHVGKEVVFVAGGDRHFVVNEEQHCHHAAHLGTPGIKF